MRESATQSPLFEQLPRGATRHYYLVATAVRLVSRYGLGATHSLQEQTRAMQ